MIGIGSAVLVVLLLFVAGVLLIVLVMLWVLPVNDGYEREEEPSIQISPLEQWLGTLYGGREFTCTFGVKNRVSRSIAIKPEILTSCICTDATLSDYELDPEEEAVLTVKLDISAVTGPVQTSFILVPEDRTIRRVRGLVIGERQQVFRQVGRVLLEGSVTDKMIEAHCRVAVSRLPSEAKGNIDIECGVQGTPFEVELNRVTLDPEEDKIIYDATIRYDVRIRVGVGDREETIVVPFVLY